MLPDKLERFAGKWVAVLDGKVIAHGTDARKVYDEALKKSNGREPLLFRVPSEDIMVF